MKNTAIIVSFYAERSNSDLLSLTSQLKRYNAHIIVVMNSDQVSNISVEKIDPEMSVIVRPNTGMNIGAWQAGFNNISEFQNYIFMQDECVIQREDFLDAYKELLDGTKNGLIGESINPRWDSPWSILQKSGLNTKIELTDQKSNVPLRRVDYYIAMMRRWSIDPGLSGRHLRALVWAARGDNLRRLCGFPIGATKHQCIAAEIAVSRKIESLDLRVVQSHEQPFHYISHVEWKRDGMSKIAVA
jgi:hypothetical protein